ncbi:MAG: hypothetical protein JWP32_2698 [Schumannella sp.]|nr:hypothetical protein [Schumannella sp.]
MTDVVDEKPKKSCIHCIREGVHGFVPVDTGGWACANAAACAARVEKNSRAANVGRCKDCVDEGIVTQRKLATKTDGSLEPGPRCVTHHRAARKVRSHKAHAKRTEANFGLTADQYWAIYAMQGGKCFGCQHATGKTKRLAVDHDHALALEHGHDPKQGCPRCVRALLCGPCNQIIGRLGVEALLRLVQVLVDPPARKWLAADLPGEPTAVPPMIDFWTEFDADDGITLDGVMAASGVTVYDGFWNEICAED